MFSQDTIDGVAAFSVIEGLCRSGVTGVLTCALEGFEKRVRFWKGRVVSADSTLIDDRMGEIIYRKGMLSLDEFVEAAGKVTKEVRFGEALIKSGVFTPLDLWDALVTQTREILASLCFYPKMEISFKSSDALPKIEYPVHEELSTIFESALAERELVERFVSLMEKDPRLFVEPQASVLADNDFRKDMMGIVEKSGDFNSVVKTDSRLSDVYTVRAIFEIFSLGILKSTKHFWEGFLREGVCKDLREEVEAANFMFAELAGAAETEGVSDWPEIVATVDGGLRRRMGSGLFVSSENGFRLDTILRSVVCDVKFARAVGAARGLAPDWLDTAPRELREILLSAVLQIHFELLNRKISSPEFLRAKEVICELRKNVS